MTLRMQICLQTCLISWMVANAAAWSMADNITHFMEEAVCKIARNQSLEHITVDRACHLAEPSMPAGICRPSMEKNWDAIRKSCDGSPENVLPLLQQMMCKVAANETIEEQAEKLICQLVTTMPQMVCQSFVKRGWEFLKGKCPAPGMDTSDLTPSDVTHFIKHQLCSMSGSIVVQSEFELFTCGFLSAMIPQFSPETCSEAFEKAWSTSASECPTTTTGAPEYLASLGWHLAGSLFCRVAGCETTTTTPVPQLGDVLPGEFLPFVEQGFCNVAGNSTVQKETESQVCGINESAELTDCQTSFNTMWNALQQKCLEPEGKELFDGMSKWIDGKFCQISSNGLAKKGLVDVACSLLQERKTPQVPKPVCTSTLDRAWVAFAAKCPQMTVTAKPDILV
jgi:hypothetical protein